MPAILPLLIRALVVWLLLMAAETLHGILRRVLLGPQMDFALRQVAVVVASAIIFGLTWLLLDWIRLRSARGALALGAAWAGLTLSFELGLGRLMGVGWSRILLDYDLSQGGLMPLGLLAMALTPWAVRELKRRRQAAAPPPAA